MLTKVRRAGGIVAAAVLPSPCLGSPFDKVLPQLGRTDGIECLLKMDKASVQLAVLIVSFHGLA